MPGLFPWRYDLSDESPQIELLTPENARELRLPWLSRFTPTTLNTFLRANRAISLWVPKTGEYLLSEPWRRREDIADIVEVTARKGKQMLVQAALVSLRGQGYDLVLAGDDVWHDQPKIYESLGFGHIEKIVYFQKDLRLPNSLQLAHPLPALRYARFSVSDLDLLLRLDHGSFPWLWWNSRSELESYVQMLDVFVFGAFDGDQPVGYASFTMYSGWAHLDRLAVLEEQQGKGLGAAQLHHILQIMVQMGAQSVSLSTQQNNTQSHHLYKGFNFRLTPDFMNLYGVWSKERRETQ